MICPRWLVQSSAVGLVGAALVALPFWMSDSLDATSKDHKTPEDNAIVHQQQSFEAPLYQVVSEVGPICPVQPHLEAPESLRQTRWIVEGLP